MKNCEQKRFSACAKLRGKEGKILRWQLTRFFLVMLNIEKDYPSNDFPYSCLPKWNRYFARKKNDDDGEEWEMSSAASNGLLHGVMYTKERRVEGSEGRLGD